MVALTTLDGRAFSKFLAAGAYFVRKYRSVLNDLNVFPVPDGDTGSNLYRTVVSALAAATRVREDGALNAVAAAAANGALLGARGNSGVIFAQMMRGFAHSVRHHAAIDTFELAVAMKDAVAAARAALLRPVEGTIVSVADAAADEAYRLAVHEDEFYRLNAAVVRAANAALDRTQEQLPALREAGVVDAGGAGFVYFLEGILAFLPEATQRATAYPRRPVKQTAFTRKQIVGANKYCTEFILADARLPAVALRDLLARRGDSLLVAGEQPVLRVHVHTDDPHGVTAIAGEQGRIEGLKVDDMERQHRVLVVDPPRRGYSILAVVPGLGFDRIARELGADETVVASAGAPAVRDLVLGIRKCLGETVVVLPNDPNLILTAREAAGVSEKRAVVVPTCDVPAGLSILIACGGRPGEAPVPSEEEFLGYAAGVRSASLFFVARPIEVGGERLRKGAPAGLIGGTLFAARDLTALAEEAARRLSGGEVGLLSLYYGGGQGERDAHRLAERLRERLPELDVEWYFGGQRSTEYVVSFER